MPNPRPAVVQSTLYRNVPHGVISARGDRSHRNAEPNVALPLGSGGTMSLDIPKTKLKYFLLKNTCIKNLRGHLPPRFITRHVPKSNRAVGGPLILSDKTDSHDFSKRKKSSASYNLRNPPCIVSIPSGIGCTWQYKSAIEQTYTRLVIVTIKNKRQKPQN